jgi:hypothetical protein
MQHDFLHETEMVYKLYMQVKTRAESYYMKELWNPLGSYSGIDIYVPEFDK